TPAKPTGSGGFDAVCNEAGGAGTRCSWRAPSVNSTVEAAIAWAEARKGDTTLDYPCFTMVHNAYPAARLAIGTPPPPDYAAWDWWAMRPSQQHGGDRNPPRGALVFWSWTGTVDGKTRNWGHVGISLGNGRVISTLFYDRVNGRKTGIHEFNIADAPTGY